MIENINKIDISIIKWIQNNLRNPVFDWMFYAITHLGDKFIFMGIVVVLYWAYDKRFAYKFLFSFLGSAVVNASLKVIVKRPRPYLNSEIESVLHDTHGYSFPSGHSQASGIIYYSFNNEFSKYSKWIKYGLIVLLIIVPFSRMYLGQHYLTDVLVGSIIGVIAAFIMFKVFDFMGDKEHIYPLIAIPFILILLAIFINKDYDKYKDLFVAGGGYVGFTLGYYFEKLYVKHKVLVDYKTRVYKLIIGVIGAGLIYFGLKVIFKAISNENLILDFIRYFSVAIYASLIAPFMFTKIFKNNVLK